MTTNTELSDEPLYADSFGYSLAMRVMQSDLYHSLDAQERAECDELIRRGQALSAVSRSEVGEPAPVGEPVAQAEYVIRLLVAAGHVTQQKVDEAFAIAKEYASPLPPSEAQGDQQ